MAGIGVGDNPARPGGTSPPGTNASGTAPRGGNGAGAFAGRGHEPLMASGSSGSGGGLAPRGGGSPSGANANPGLSVMHDFANGPPDRLPAGVGRGGESGTGLGSRSNGGGSGSGPQGKTPSGSDSGSADPANGPKPQRTLDLVVSCGPKGGRHPSGGLSALDGELKAKDANLVKSLRTIAAARQVAEPEAIWNPRVRFQVEPGGQKTYWTARGTGADGGPRLAHHRPPGRRHPPRPSDRSFADARPDNRCPRPPPGESGDRPRGGRRAGRRPAEPADGQGPARSLRRHREPPAKVAAPAVVEAPAPAPVARVAPQLDRGAVAVAEEDLAAARRDRQRPRRAWPPRKTPWRRPRPSKRTRRVLGQDARGPPARPQRPARPRRREDDRPPHRPRPPQGRPARAREGAEAQGQAPDRQVARGATGRRRGVPFRGPPRPDRGDRPGTAPGTGQDRRPHPAPSHRGHGLEHPRSGRPDRRLHDGLRTRQGVARPPEHPGGLVRAPGLGDRPRAGPPGRDPARRPEPRLRLLPIHQPPEPTARDRHPLGLPRQLHRLSPGAARPCTPEASRSPPARCPRPCRSEAAPPAPSPPGSEPPPHGLAAYWP